MKQYKICSKCLNSQCECELENKLISLEERFNEIFELYELDENYNLVKIDMKKFSENLESGKNHLFTNYISSERYGMITISTIFLGIKHHGDKLFETMVFREKNVNSSGLPVQDDCIGVGFWGEMRRYKTYEEAKQGHMDVYQSIVGKPLIEGTNQYND